MKINYNPTKMKDWLFEDTIQTQASLFLESESNTYVVFDGTAKILCEGTLDECYVYQAEYNRAMGFTPSIYAKETYETMMNKLKKSYEEH
jgi:hypothetical protein